VSTDEQPYIIYEKRLPFVVTKYGPVVGLGINQMTVNIESPFYTFNNSFNHQGIPALGLFLSLNFPSIMNQHANIIIEGIYFQRKLQAPENEYHYITLSQQVWQSSFMGRYRFPGSGLRPTLQAGFFFQNFIKNSFYRKFDLNSDMDNPGNPVVNRFNFFKDYHAGLSVGVGLASRKWTIDFRYQFGVVYGNRPDVNTQALQLNLGYSLN
jgi:hypothetical protein